MTHSDSSAAIERPAPRGRMPLTALCGALGFVGLGHFLVGRFRRGILWAITIWGLGALAFAAIFARMPVPLFAGLIVVIIALQVAAIIDAVVCGWRPARYWGRWWSRGLVAVVALVGGVYLNTQLSTALALKFRESCEAFRSPTNAMLPTLAGIHTAGVCTKCGAHVPLADVIPATGDIPFANTIGLCQNCGELLDERAQQPVNSLAQSPDRFLINKRLAPRRWDIIVFPCPDDPGELYVMRLVGLPGEQVELSGRDVKINGQVLEKPDGLQFLHYVGIPRKDGWPGWGQEGNAVTLGPDEVFVLGDFSTRARDSRGWRTAAAGGSAYAVPVQSIVGVATHIYWPPSRWRLFPRYAAE